MLARYIAKRISKRTPPLPMNADEQSNLTRRPIAVRNSAWARSAARWATGIGLTPNAVSILSMVFSAMAAIGLELSFDVEPTRRAALLIVAAACIQLRLLCNLLDGLMAVEGGLKSCTGDLYNDLPDRISDALTLIGAGYAVRQWPMAVELGWLAALLAVMTAYVRVLGASIGVAHQFCGPLAKQQRMAVITVACVFSLIEPWLHWRGQIMLAALGMVALGCLITISRRLSRIVGVLRSRSS